MEAPNRPNQQLCSPLSNAVKKWTLCPLKPQRFTSDTPSNHRDPCFPPGVDISHCLVVKTSFPLWFLSIKFGEKQQKKQQTTLSYSTHPNWANQASERGADKHLNQKADSCRSVCVYVQTDMQASHVRQIILHSGRKLIQHTYTEGIKHLTLAAWAVITL